MAFNGYFSYSGTEVINSTRTEAYARNDGAGWFSAVYKADDLPLLLNDTPYRSPLQDADTPWVDPDVPDSYEFYGVYPLDVQGIEDSTRTAVTVQSTLNGGTPGRLRHATRSIVFDTILIGSTEMAVEYGMRWLKSALLGPCAQTIANCSGADLCYLSAYPTLGDSAEDCYAEVARTLKNVTFTNGPRVVKKSTTFDGSTIWQVQFTAVAGIPWEFGSERRVVEQLFYGGTPNYTYASELVDTNGGNVGETTCPDPVYQPVTDPACPALIPPPPPPDVPLGCFTRPSGWHRYAFTIPREDVPIWDAIVPRFEVFAANRDVRNIRFRFWADPENNGNVGDECDNCGEYLITYIPQGSSIIIDGRDQTVVLKDDLTGAQRVADTLVIDSLGRPFKWVEMTCGFRYLVGVDMLQTQITGNGRPIIDFSVYPKVF